MGILRKNNLIFLLSFGILINLKLYGQIQIDASYMMPSNYRDDTNTEIGGAGDFKDIRLGSMKKKFGTPIFFAVPE